MGSDRKVLENSTITSQTGIEPFLAIITTPPNPTGKLHLGHVFNLTLQDIVSRYALMNGKRLYWSSAMDHGATSTQFVVEKQLQTTHGIKPGSGSEQLVGESLEQWVQSVTPFINRQIERLGISMDTSVQVSMGDSKRQQQFIDLLHQLADSNLLSIDNRIVDWCIGRKTSLGPTEVVYSNTLTKYHEVIYREQGCLSNVLRCPVDDLGLIGAEVAINVDAGSKYGALLGKSFVGPFGRCLPVVDIGLCSRDNPIRLVIPAHCERSCRWAEKACIPFERPIDAEGLRAVSPYCDMPIDLVRDKIYHDLNASGVLGREIEVKESRKVCKISGEIVVSLLTTQIFLDIAPLLSKATELLADLSFNIVPERYRQYCSMWIKQTRFKGETSWCISRQVYWGNSIDIRRYTFLQNLPKPSRILDPQNLNNARLDMMISCAFWAFCSNKMHARTLDEFHHLSKNSLVITGQDLTSFWVIPIILFATVLKEGLPFSSMLIHPLICDKFGNKMTKSLGNVIDPDEIIQEYRADALRLALLKKSDMDENELHFDVGSVKLIDLELNELLQLCKPADDKRFLDVELQFIEKVGKTIHKVFEFHKYYLLPGILRETLQYLKTRKAIDRKTDSPEKLKKLCRHLVIFIPNTVDEIQKNITLSG